MWFNPRLAFELGSCLEAKYVCRARLLITVGVSQQAALTRLLQLESTVTILPVAPPPLPINVVLLYFTHYCAVPSPGISRCCRSSIVKRFDPKRDGTPLKSLSLWLLLLSKYISKFNADLPAVKDSEQQWLHSQNSSTLWQQLIIITEGGKKRSAKTM